MRKVGVFFSLSLKFLILFKPISEFLNIHYYKRRDKLKWIAHMIDGICCWLGDQNLAKFAGTWPIMNEPIKIK